MSNQDQFRQLAYFSTILGEVVLTPTGLGALGYYLAKDSAYRLPITFGLGGLGFLIAFYRISKLKKVMEGKRD